MKKFGISKLLLSVLVGLVLALTLWTPAAVKADEAENHEIVLTIDGVEYTYTGTGAIIVPDNVDLSDGLNHCEIWFKSYDGQALENVGNKSGVLDSFDRTVLEICTWDDATDNQWKGNFVFHAEDDPVESNQSLHFGIFGLTIMHDSGNGQFDKITLSETKYIYDGKKHVPNVTITSVTGRTLKGDNYFTLSYSGDCKNVGSYEVTATGIGEYEGSTLSETFVIKPKGTTVSKLTARNKGFTVKVEKYTTQTTGYQIRYRIKGTSEWNIVTISKNTSTSKKISSLKSKKTYQVQVRTYKTVSGKKYFSGWSATKSVKTK